ncbi:MAG: DegT/DnrJ/EryC1/StrS aminotransferase, partial [Magnetospirillum sp.]
RLPTADALLPWLRRIDQTRIYANNGPLVVEFSHRLCRHFGLSDGGVLPVANATQGLTACLLTLGVKPGTLCAMPAFTFVATAHAALAAGLVPWLLDVDEAGWQLTPAGFERALAAAPGEVGAVIPVCPFGQPVDWSGWARIRHDTGIAVVIDAAAAFDALRPGPLPAVVSLHATKALGVGEGGLVVSDDPDLVGAVVQRINFGFRGTREAICPATNAKMSEIEAAVGLVGLEQWPATRAAFAHAQLGLRRRLERPDIVCQTGIGEGWVSSTFCVRLPSAVAAADDLARRGIETRRWWGDGLHRHPAFAGCPHADLTVTERLAGGVLGLPCWPDLDEAGLDAVAAATLAAVAGQP